MINVQLITGFLSSLTFMSDIIILFILLAGIYTFAFRKESPKVMEGLRTFFKKHSILFAFIVAFVATLGSLFYSEIALYEPCKLCWYQRIFMYPLVLMFAIALWKKDRRVFRYAIPMTVVGGIIATYHYITQMIQYSATCGTNVAVPCTIKYIFHFGYVTISMMALTAFILIIILGYWTKK